MANIPPLPPNPASVAAMLQAVTAPDEPVVLTATIQSLPDKFAALTRPVQINGVPLAVTDNGFVSMRTSAGDLLLQLIKPPDAAPGSLKDWVTPFIQNQKPIGLTIQPGNPPTQASASLPSLASALSATSTPQLGNLNAGQNVNPLHPALTLGKIVTATVLPNGIGNAFAASLGAEALSQLGTAGLAGEVLAKTSSSSSITGLSNMLGTPLKLSLLGDFLKTPAVSTLADAIKNFIHDTDAEPAAVKSFTSVSAPFESSSQATVASLKPGAEWHIRIDSFLQPGKAIPPPDSPDQTVATVVGKGPDGQLVINADNKTLYIREVSDAPVGSKLRITLLAPKTEQETALPALKGYEAPSLHKLMAALAEIQPQLARQLMQSVIPQPNAQLPATLLFLFNALNQQGVKGWLGDDVTNRLTKANRLELVSKLVEEMQQAMGTARDPVVGQWRSWPIPLYDGQNFQMMHLYVRRDRDRKQTGAGYPVSPQTRFIVTMNMTRLGLMQVDGLSQKKQLDLILRSERPLPAHLPNELRATYIKTMEALGLAGSLNFQTGRQNWVAVQRVAESAGVVT